jgi:hypothetical protein
MKFIVKAFDLNGREIKFEKTVIHEKEVIFDHSKAAEAFIKGIKNSFPSTFQYRIFPTEVL